jgi:hypothetical protein
LPHTSGRGSIRTICQEQRRFARVPGLGERPALNRDCRGVARADVRAAAATVLDVPGTTVAVQIGGGMSRVPLSNSVRNAPRHRARAGAGEHGEKGEEEYQEAALHEEGFLISIISCPSGATETAIPQATLGLARVFPPSVRTASTARAAISTTYSATVTMRSADLENCPRCSGPMRWAEVATSRAAIRRLLAAHGLGPRAPPITRAPTRVPDLRVPWEFEREPRLHRFGVPGAS